jgi:hypothetical protein
MSFPNVYPLSPSEQLSFPLNAFADGFAFIVNAEQNVVQQHNDMIEGLAEADPELATHAQDAWDLELKPLLLGPSKMTKVFLSRLDDTGELVDFTGTTLFEALNRIHNFYRSVGYKNDINLLGLAKTADGHITLHLEDALA